MIDKKQIYIVESLLFLVRFGVGHQSETIPCKFVWPSIFNVSIKQGVSAIVLDGIQRMYDMGLGKLCEKMDVDLKLEWISVVHHNYERSFLKYKESLGHLAHFYNSHGFRLMVLKGYGLNLLYPVPEHRQCGDIDTWAFGNYKAVDNAICNEFKIKIDSTHHHHTVYEWEGIGVENHYDFVNVHYGHRNAELEMIFKDLAKDDSCSIDINGETLYLPSPNLNALFLLRHTMLHFASTGMTVRHLLDWGFFLKKHSSEVDWGWLLSVLKEFDMVTFFDVINSICVNQLGFDASCYPYIKTYNNLCKRILYDMIFPEFNDCEPQGTLNKYIFKLRRRHANTWKREICYSDSGLRSFVQSVMSHIVKPRS